MNKYRKKQSFGINPFRPVKIKHIKINNPHFNFDTDRDGVRDRFDCQPFNPWKQDTDDWISGKKRRPKIEKNVHNREVPYEEFEDMSFKEKMGYFEGLDNTTIAKKEYKNYLIEFNKFPKGHKVGPYEEHPRTDIYLPNVVYAIGFEYDYSSPHNVKHGKTIGTGRTVNEAFNEAKKYIDKENNYNEREVQKAKARQREFDKISKRLHELISIGARRDLTNKEVEEFILLQDKLYEWRDRELRFESD